MDAVRRFVESGGGTVDVVLQERIDVINELFAFQFLIRLPKVAEIPHVLFQKKIS